MQKTIDIWIYRFSISLTQMGYELDAKIKHKKVFCNRHLIFMYCPGIYLTNNKPKWL